MSITNHQTPQHKTLADIVDKLVEAVKHNDPVLTEAYKDMVIGYAMVR